MPSIWYLHAWRPAGYRRDLDTTQFAHNLEALIVDASARGLSDEDIITNVLHPGELTWHGPP
jgi:hypothetical protein